MGTCDMTYANTRDPLTVATLTSEYNLGRKKCPDQVIYA